jgi:hypothetical protein
MLLANIHNLQERPASIPSREAVMTDADLLSAVGTHETELAD